VAADIAGADGAQKCIGQGVQADIRIGVSNQTRIEGDRNTAQHDMVAGSEAVHIVSHTSANLAPTQKPLTAVEIVRGGYLKIVFAARHQSDGKASPFGDGGIIGQSLIGETPVGVENVGETESLRSLRPP
jgi:hypothetical protein